MLQKITFPDDRAYRVETMVRMFVEKLKGKITTTIMRRK